MGERLRVFVVGGTGTIGRATLRALAAAGHETVALVRSESAAEVPMGIELRRGQVSDPVSLRNDGFRGEPFDAVISCLASRTGAPEDAWAIDHAANSAVLAAAREAGARRFVLLSAICVQKPELAFQQAKLAFEAELQESRLVWSIVRPTAFFKSLSGQVERVRSGKPFLLFGDGRVTACKPISDSDLAAYLVHCLEDEALQNRILPIGGPGPAITPREQGEALFRMLGQEPKFRQVPLAMMDGIVGVLSPLGRVSPVFREKAELARIGRYYARESMLVLDPVTGRYSSEMTPETGSETLFDFYEQLLSGDATVDLGEHAVF